MATRKNITSDILDMLNNASLTDILINIDELPTERDGICLTETDSTPEKADDVSSRDWVSGTLSLSVIYRVITVDDGIDDLNYTNVIDNIIGYFTKNYRQIDGDGYIIDLVKDNQAGKLDVVYSDGTKDFKGTVKVSYCRKL